MMAPSLITAVDQFGISGTRVGVCGPNWPGTAFALWRSMPAAYPGASGTGAVGDLPAAQPRAGSHHRGPARRPRRLAARRGLCRQRQDHGPAPSGRGRYHAGPLHRLQQEHPARGPGPLSRPCRLPHHAQPGLSAPCGCSSSSTASSASSPAASWPSCWPSRPSTACAPPSGASASSARCGASPTAPRARSTAAICRLCRGGRTAPSS